MLTHRKWTLSLLLALSLLGLNAETLIFEQNIYISDPKSAKNEVDPKDLEREKREKENRRLGRRLSQYLNGEIADPMSFFHPTKNRLFTNRIFLVEIDSERHSAKTDIEVSINQSASFFYKQPIQLPFSGWNEIRYRAIDLLQNEEPWRSKFIFRDDIGPKISYRFEGPTYKQDDTIYTTEQTSLKLTSEDEGSGVFNQFIKIEDGDWVVWEENDSFFKHMHGKNKLSLAALDNVYNRSSLIQISTQVISSIESPILETDNTVSEMDGIYCNQKSSFWFQTINHQIPYSVFWKKSNVQYFSKYVKGIILLDDGREGEDYQIDYFVKDELGNHSKVETWKCKFDSKPPKTDIYLLKEETP